MTIDENILQRAAEAAIELLIEKYDNLRMRASGKWADGLSYQIDGNTVTILGYDYTEYLAKGRPPGTLPPVTKIYQWMQVKPGFTGPKDMSRAFAIAHNIKKKGTSWYQKGGSDLVEVLEDPEVTSLFYKIVEEGLLVSINEQLVRTVLELEE